MNREFASDIAPAIIRAASALAATGTSAYVDLMGADAVTVVVHHGAVTASAGANNVVLKLQHADSSPASAGSYSDVPDDSVRGSFTKLENGVSEGVDVVGYVGSKRYLRVVATLTGTASAAATGMVAYLGYLGQAPAGFTPATGAVS